MGQSPVFAGDSMLEGGTDSGLWRLMVKHGVDILETIRTGLPKTNRAK
jgi:hypothetical protein